MPVFYYAGHGVQVDGENYLSPVDFDGHDEADLKFRTQSASWVQEKLDKTGAQLKILILDACRTNPFRVSRDGGDGLAQIQGGRGSFIAFATAAGKVANDNVQDNNGLFTKHLVARLQQPGPGQCKVTPSKTQTKYRPGHVWQTDQSDSCRPPKTIAPDQPMAARYRLGVVPTWRKKARVM